MAYPNALFSTFTFIGFLMCMVTFPLQLEAWNSGTCVFMVWAALGCLNQFINSIVWNHNYVNRAPIWCDISTKFMIGLNVAMPAAALCIARRLYHISTLQSITVTRAAKRRHVIVDLLIGLGLPVVEMVLHYIVQGHRFDILEDVGCVTSTYLSWPSFVIVSLPPVIIGLISSIYAVLNIIQFRKLRNQINDFAGYKNLTTTRYFHFICLSSVDIIFTVPLSAYNLSNDVRHIRPWVSWADTKWGFSNVYTVPSVIWRSNPTTLRVIEINRWVVVLCAFVFFGFFGFTAQSREGYLLCIKVITGRANALTSKVIRQGNLTPILFQSARNRHNVPGIPSNDTSISLSTSGHHSTGEAKYFESDSIAAKDEEKNGITGLG
ncbi:Pheromone B alpha 3 receptor [Psilocybe cubensis]|uniref:Pheromone receptor n=2 Tax=Psilocybe cubensis TaxID=181762 RepID=A0A8H8CML4_PSICU|nr:Pheromone B alpha 3 receptor [Psilocybe cubensis]KAH9484589.1 Pheromone B alpha 3 receptor [Psilocybe cubensis]